MLAGAREGEEKREGEGGIRCLIVVRRERKDERLAPFFLYFLLQFYTAEKHTKLKIPTQT